MQQDDQNTFKIHSSTMDRQNQFQNQDNLIGKKPNLITKVNIIREGINFIVPSFWYQELIQINQSSRTLQDLIFPHFQLLARFLRLYALQNPSESPFQINQKYSAFSSSFLADLIEQNNFNVSKTLKFSKLNDLRECNEIQWSLINPQLWNLIKNRFHFIQSNKQQQKMNEKQQRMRISEIDNLVQLPCLGMRLKKELILQKGQSKASKTNNLDQHSLIQIYYKSQKYSLRKEEVQKQITKQLKSLSHEQTNFLLIIDQRQGNNQLLLKKLSVAGFFQQDMSLKELVRSLIQMESVRREIDEKFYISGQNGEKVRQKINTISSLNELTQWKQIIISTLPLQSIAERKMGLKNILQSLLSSISNENYQNPSQIEDNRSLWMQQISNSFHQRAKKFEFECLKRTIRQIGKQSQNKGGQNKQQIRSGFKFYTNQITMQANFVQCVENFRNGFLTFNNSDPTIQINPTQTTVFHQIAEEFRIESLTTNMDTPNQEESQSQHLSSNISYENKKLHRHSSYNRQQRKKKAQSYLQKKKKSTVILKDNSATINRASTYGEYKKRVRHCLFHSLASLQKEDEALVFLIQNMKMVARSTIFVEQLELIKHPYKKLRHPQNQSNGSGQKQNKKQVNSYFKQKTSNQNIEASSKQKEQNTSSLQQIAQMIQHQYQPHLSAQKQSPQQLQKIELYSEYDPQLMMKKDNQEIKTIVDNSEGPYSQIQKQQISSGIKQRYRIQERRRDVGQQMEVQQGNNDQINSMTDGLNYIEDNQQTL